MWSHPLARRAYQPNQQEQPWPRPGEEAYQELVSAARQMAGLAEEVDIGGTQGMATERVRTVQVMARHGSAATCNDPRPGLGYPGAGGGS